MPEILFQPLNEGPPWDGPATPSHKPCQFKATYSTTERELLAELRQIGTHAAVLELDLGRGDLRVTDGLPRAGAVPRTSRVRLSFQHRRHGKLSFACWTYSHWHDNLRAIRMTLEALRAVDRYGAVQGDKQYTGFRQLPEPGKASGSMTYVQARMELGFTEHAIVTEEAVKDRYRGEAKRRHPDAAGGSQAAFQRLTQARDMLLRSIGVTP